MGMRMFKSRKLLCAAVASLSLLAACGKKGGGDQDFTHRVQALVDRAQACKDLDCAKKVQDELGEIAGKATNSKDGLSHEEADFLFKEAQPRVDAVVDRLSGTGH
jgi:hypothetical protein